MKKILIDLSKIKNLYSGLGQFSEQFGSYLNEEHAHEFEFHFLVPRDHDLHFSPLIKQIKVNPLLRWWRSSHEQYDLWHSLHQFPAYKPPRGFRQLLTIHDLNFLVEKNGNKKKAYLLKLQKEIEQASCVSTISEYTKSQIIEQFPDINKPIQVIHNGVKELTKVKPDYPKYLPKGDFLFSISLFSPKKNFETLIPMMKLIPNKQLVIAGNHDNKYGHHIKELIKLNGLEGQVLLPGTIKESEKVALYQSCEAFCFPSRAEGFGMPVIEAMQFGKPTFISNLTSLPEVGAKAAQYFEHFDEEHMANTIKAGLVQYYKHPEAHQHKIKDQANRFTWQRCMQQYINLYYDLTQ